MQNARATTLLMVAALCLAVGFLGCSGSENLGTVPRQTALSVTLSTTTRSDRATPGVKLRGRLERAVVIDGETLLEAAQPVTMEVLASRAAEGDAPARIALTVTRIWLSSGQVEVLTEPLEIVGRPEGTADTDGLTPGGVVTVTTKGDAIVLPAGQRLFFTTSSDIEVPRP